MDNSNLGQEKQPVFSIEKLYVKDSSLEVPLSPSIFLERQSPQVELELDCDHKNIEGFIFEVTVSVSVKASAAEKVLFIIEVTQAGIFQLKNIPENYVDTILGVDCPNIIFPYLRESVTDLSTKAGFPPVYMSPVNFQALFEQRKSANNKQADAV
ncbi:protein-export chaperone SecB [Candidatus Ichthyocystis hellenicum]|uniref:protein-export chaperone SecB n=1 Tax=Candidatus Ichthyocystis hellenicum TaxID=1561003 RepID=UPI000A7EC75B|nr:protein-export chaperone SecB [Candidatus Ichthyocystis hellenicum]